jgi:hypothetical protein
MAAARRIYNVECNSAGFVAPTGYRSFGLQPLRMPRCWRGRPQDDGGGLGAECTVNFRNWYRGENFTVVLPLTPFSPMLAAKPPTQFGETEASGRVGSPGRNRGRSVHELTRGTAPAGLPLSSTSSDSPAYRLLQAVWLEVSSAVPCMLAVPFSTDTE